LRADETKAKPAVAQEYRNKTMAEIKAQKYILNKTGGCD
jgi:hypothetical protein